MPKYIHAVNAHTDDDAVGDAYMAFRRLCSVVFQRAVADLFDKNKKTREDALTWFRRKIPDKRENMIYFSDCVEVLSFTEARMKLLEGYILQSINPETVKEVTKNQVFNSKRHGRPYYKKIKMLTGGRH